jgi:putative transposase
MCRCCDMPSADGNHVHVFVGAAPRYAPSRVMQVLKSVSARMLFERFPDLRKTLWGAGVLE